MPPLSWLLRVRQSLDSLLLRSSDVKGKTPDPIPNTFSRVLKAAHVNLLWVWPSNLFFSAFPLLLVFLPLPSTDSSLALPVAARTTLGGHNPKDRTEQEIMGVFPQTWKLCTLHTLLPGILLSLIIIQRVIVVVNCVRGLCLYQSYPSASHKSSEVQMYFPCGHVRMLLQAA